MTKRIASQNRTIPDAIVRAVLVAAVATTSTSCARVDFSSAPAASVSLAAKGPQCAQNTTPLDLLIVQDVTGSMGDAISELERNMTGMVSEVSLIAGNAQFGLAVFQDWPSPIGGGNATDLPYRLVRPLTASAATVKQDLGLLVAQGGGDGPESALEALYQAATSSAIGWRSGSKRVIVLLTDAPFAPVPVSRGFTRNTVKAALANTGISVIGVSLDDDAQLDLRDFAIATGALAKTDIDVNANGSVDESSGDVLRGQPLVFPFEVGPPTTPPAGGVSSMGGGYSTGTGFSPGTTISGSLARTIAAGLVQVVCASQP